MLSISQVVTERKGHKMKTIIALLLLSISAFAESLHEKVAALQSSGVTSALDIRIALLRPGETITITNKVMTVKPAAQLAWEKDALAEIEAFVESVTGDKRDALQRISVLDSRGMLLAVRGGKAARQAEKEKIMDLSDALTLMYLDSMRATDTHPAYPWPLPADFGQEFTTELVPIQIDGKPWWKANGLKEPPSVEAILKEMK